ncbi:haloacid dehalogenase [Arthrobacter sp. UCD-GKA]|uniref:HAD family hydrolase n=1 Tax=Arthrobacter sp. UCD-GKA TaxID=1913576 RepID=UPI0008DD960E|nr:HAD family phosphatase [Arthrobacter sp. UCD-GKA]OIH84188.1 haloacid dehalogenase [Arthrobacter sp. UCD-GKA]
MPTQNCDPLPSAALNTEIQGVLWDMDGTLLDTEPYWMAAEAALVAEFGGRWSEDQAMALVGNALPDAAAALQRAGVALPEREIIDRLTAEVLAGVRRHVNWRPGALELLETLHRANIPCGLVTMSEEPLAALVLEQLPHPYFGFRVTGDMVSRGKPHPDPYLLGLDMLGRSVADLEPARVIGLEDSAPGIASAAASGITAVLIPHIAPVPDSASWHRVGSLQELDLQALGTLVSAGART